MKHILSIVAACVVLCAPPAVLGSGEKPKKAKGKSLTERYEEIVGNVDTLQESLDGAAAVGYRVLFGDSSRIRNSIFVDLILEKSTEPSEAYEYLLVGAVGAWKSRLQKNTERELNAAGALGFRLLPRTLTMLESASGGVLQRVDGKWRDVRGDETVALMLKAPGPLQRYRYLLLSTRGRFVPWADSPFQKALAAGGLQGWEVVGLVSDGKMVVLEKAIEASGEAPAPAEEAEDEQEEKPREEPDEAGALRDEEPNEEQSKPDLTQPYLLLATTRTARMQRELNEAAAAGYRVVSCAPDKDGIAVLLKKVAQPPETYQYLLVATTKASTMQTELNEGGSQGFLLLPQTIMKREVGKGGDVSMFKALGRGGVTDEILAVMEKAAGSQKRYEYLVPGTFRFSTFRKEVGEAITQGYQVVGGLVGLGYMAVLEKPAVP